MEVLRVLVVDDEPGIRLAVVRSLRRYSMTLPGLNGEVRFEPDAAESGVAALEKIEAAPPHILLLDLKLPDMTGLEILDQLSGRKLDTLTIMITAYASIETAVHATKSGAFDFLAKPFTPDELESAVRKAARHIVATKQAAASAQEKRQVRFQFLSVLAHELKSPLNAIEGYLEIIRRRSAGEDPKVYEQMIDRCTMRIQYMRKMILDLLDLTRIESGLKKRELTPVALREVAQTVLESNQMAAAENEVTIALKVDGNPVMIADRGELEIVLNNLVSNAVKYNRPGGRVEMRLGRKGAETIVEVEDTGIGMDEEEVARLFGNFVRIKNEKTRNILGSGLGLAIVKRVAELYGGEVKVASKPGVGSTFTLILREPAATPAE